MPEGWSARAYAAVSRGSGVVAVASFLPAAAAYAAGDVVDTIKELAFKYSDGSAVAPGALIRVTSSILKIGQTALRANESSYTLQLYSSATPGAVLNDNDAWVLAAAELGAYRGSIGLGVPVLINNACYIYQGGLVEERNLPTGISSLWGRLVTVGNPTFTAVARDAYLQGFVV